MAVRPIARAPGQAIPRTQAPTTAVGTPCAVGCQTIPVPVFSLDGHAVVLCKECQVYAVRGMAAHDAAPQLDRTQIEGALKTLRLENYAHVLRRMSEISPLPGRSLLDIGCSSGWFLEMAVSAGCLGHGIEPDGFFYNRLADHALPDCKLVQGSFDRDLPSDWGPFDFITVHDVFEHLPDPMGVLEAARTRLAPGGHVVLSLPVADGFAFRMGCALYRLGITQPLARLFQIKYPYPHLFYFSRRSLVRLADRAGFDVVLLEPLRSFSARGTLQRARMDSARGVLGTIRQYASAGALLAFAGVERFLPPDNVLAILRRRSN